MVEITGIKFEVTAGVANSTRNIVSLQFTTKFIKRSFISAGFRFHSRVGLLLRHLYSVTSITRFAEQWNLIDTNKEFPNTQGTLYQLFLRYYSYINYYNNITPVMKILFLRYSYNNNPYNLPTKYLFPNHTLPTTQLQQSFLQLLSLYHPYNNYSCIDPHHIPSYEITHSNMRISVGWLAYGGKPYGTLRARWLTPLGGSPWHCASGCEWPPVVPLLAILVAPLHFKVDLFLILEVICALGLRWCVILLLVGWCW